MTREERLRSELEMVRRQFGTAELDPERKRLVVVGWELGSGWSISATDVIVLIPPAYPATPPDNFFTCNDLRLANGHLPGCTSLGHQIAGRQCLQFSYHVEPGEWRPGAEPGSGDNLTTFLAAVGRRLSEEN